MEYLKIKKEFPRLMNTAVTLGKFDGIHRGHMRLVDRVLELKEQGAQGVMFAFDVSSKMILTREERKKLLAGLGMDVLIECPLDHDMKHMKAEAFVKEILVGDLQAKYVVVGEDFRFGYERKGTPQLLENLGQKYGFEVSVIPREMDGRRKVSSTYIREELLHGNTEKIRSLMGRHFFVDGVVEHGRGLGHKKLLPTANLIPPKEKLMPPNGVYETVSVFEDRCYCGITNVGYKPTVDGEFLGIETFLFDCEENLYGKECRIKFLHYSRPEKKFRSLEALKEQLSLDEKKGREYFEKNPVDKM